MNLRNMIPDWIFPFLQRISNIRNIVIYNFYKIMLKQDDKNILLYSVSRSSLSGNLWYVNREINKKDFNVDIVLEGDNTTNAQLLKKIAAAKYIIIDDYTKMLYTLKLRKGTRLIQVWHSTGAMKRMGFARMGRKGSTVKTSLTHRNYTDVIVSSEGVIENFVEAFGVDRDCIHPIGVPRTDIFFDLPTIEQTKKNLNEKYPQISGKKLVLFAPTFRGETRETAYYPSEFLPFDKLIEALGSDYIVGLKLHPFIKEKFDIPVQFQNQIVDFSEYREINDLLFITDILVTDYSSVLFEYAFLVRPLVLYAPDLDTYINDRDFFYPYADYAYGTVAKTVNELADAVKAEKIDTDKMAAFKDKFLSACDGNSSIRFVNMILEEGE